MASAFQYRRDSSPLVECYHLLPDHSRYVVDLLREILATLPDHQQWAIITIESRSSGKSGRASAVCKLEPHCQSMPLRSRCAVAGAAEPR